MVQRPLYDKKTTTSIPKQLSPLVKRKHKPNPSSRQRPDTPPTHPNKPHNCLCGDDIVKGGGVITFDVGGYKVIDGKSIPCLDIPEAQRCNCVCPRRRQDIPVSDGSGRFASGVPATSNH